MKYINSRKRIYFDIGDPEYIDSLHLEVRYYYRNCSGKLKTTWQAVERIAFNYRYNEDYNVKMLLEAYKEAGIKKRNKRRIYRNNLTN